MPVLAKSRTLRVTRKQSCALAVAAMIESKAAIDLPCASALTVICAQTRATLVSKESIRFSKLVSSAWSHWLSSVRRLDSGSRVTPRCNSPKAMALVQSSCGFRASSQRRTCWSGVFLTASDSTQVSSRYFTARDPEFLLSDVLAQELPLVVHSTSSP